MKISQLREHLADPATLGVRVRARRSPEAVIRRQAELARALGFDRPFLVLSFDCDTADDAAVVTGVHRRLAELGVCPTYAVPGALLERAADVYAPLAETGAEFVNHGGAEHTYFDDRLGRHASSFFYDTLDPERVSRDIEDGHRICRDVLGKTPRGWRTPHFGTYSAPAQLRHLHQTLLALDYRFSSSTLPRVALRHGPLYRGFGLPELPVTGIPIAPLEILDTWGFFAAPDRTRTPVEYLEQAQLLARAIANAGAGVINVYGDPLHIHDSPEFFAAVEAWTRVAEPISFAGLLDRIAA
jgi:peptidoglycan/xylan/chitin deacetylase (PgdA/CDA1 family)